MINTESYRHQTAFRINQALSDDLSPLARRHVAEIAIANVRTLCDEIDRLRQRAQVLLPALEALMSGISERERCAGWALGLEYALWEAINEGNPRWDLTDGEIIALRTLSALMGGWAMWDAVQDKPVFVPLAEWQKYLRSPGL